MSSAPPFLPTLIFNLNSDDKSEAMTNILELANKGIQNFEVDGGITIDTLLPDEKGRYVTQDKKLILTHLLGDLVRCVHDFDTKNKELLNKIEESKIEFDKLKRENEKMKNELKEYILKNEKAIKANIDNLVTLREKYLKDRVHIE